MRPASERFPITCRSYSVALEYTGLIQFCLRASGQQHANCATLTSSERLVALIHLLPHIFDANLALG